MCRPEWIEAAASGFFALTHKEKSGKAEALGYIGKGFGAN